jgi:hypothetical protein
MLRTRHTFASIALVALIASGCSKGGSESSPAKVPATYLFFNDSGTNAVIAVDPRNATTLIIEPASSASIYDSTSFLTGRFDPASGLFVNARTSAFAYLKTDASGKLQLFKVDALLGATPPAPVRVSTLSASSNCNYWFNQDYAQADHSSLMIAAPGPDGVCGTADDDLSLVPLYLAANADPVVAHATHVYTVRPVYDPKGAIGAWLMYDNIAGELFWEPPLLTAHHPLASVAWNWRVLAAPAGKIWLDVASSLKYWSLDAGSLADPGGAPTTLPSAYSSAADNQYLYIGDRSGPGGSVQRVRLDGSAVPQVVYTLPAGATLQTLKLTTNRILISTDTREYFTVPKGGGAATKVFTPYPYLSNPYVMVRAIGSSLFFEFYDPWTIVAAKMAEDGSDAVSFVSTTASQGWTFAGGTSFPIDEGSGANASRAVLFRGGDWPSIVATNGSASSYLSGEPWTLRTFDAASRAGESKVGTLPEGWFSPGPGAEASGTVTLLTARRQDAGSDVFLVDLMKDDSVVQITSVATDKTCGAPKS